MKTTILALILATTNIHASIDNVLLELKYRMFEIHCELHNASYEDKLRIIGKIEGIFEAIELIEQDISQE